MSSNLDGDLNGDGIVDEMDRVRSDLGGEINQLGEGMRNMFDWQAYVRSAPLTSAAAAIVVGFLIAPRLRSRPAPAVTSPLGSKGSSSPASLSTLLNSVVLGGLARAGSTYFGDFLSRQFMTSSTNDSEDSEPPESAQPF